MQTLHLDILPKTTKRAIESLKKLKFLSRSGWYLAGGTALALQGGHRQSDDLDFFCTKKFKENILERNLFETGEWMTDMRDNGTLYGKFLGAKASFIFYPFFKPSEERIHFGGIPILTAPDIAAMKIIAISQRGRKRDFVDLYWYAINKEPILSIIGRALAQYPGHKQSTSHIIKSLVYFEDAEADPMPKIYFKADWRGIKSYFRRIVPEITKELLLL